MSQHIKNFYVKHAHWIPRLFLIFTFLILVLTLTPDDTFSKSMLKKFDKYFHALFFGGWTFLFWLTLNISKPGKPPNPIMIFIFATLFGISIEIFQYILPIDRALEIMDIFSNMVGITIVIALIQVYNRLQFGKKNN